MIKQSINKNSVLINTISLSNPIEAIVNRFNYHSQLIKLLKAYSNKINAQNYIKITKDLMKKFYQGKYFSWPFIQLSFAEFKNFYMRTIINSLYIYKNNNGLFLLTGKHKDLFITSLINFPLNTLDIRDLKKINAILYKNISNEIRYEILEYWNFISTKTIGSLNILLTLKFSKLLPPLPGLIRRVPHILQCFLTKLYFFNFLSNFTGNKIIKNNKILHTIDLSRKNKYYIKLPRLMIEYNFKYKNNYVLTNILKDTSKTLRVINILNHYNLLTIDFFIIVGHALFFYNDKKANILDRKYKNSIRYFRKIILNKIPFNVYNYVIEKYLSVDFKQKIMISDYFFENIIENVLLNTSTPETKLFPLKYLLKINSNKWKVHPLNSYAKIKKEGKYQKNCLQTYNYYIFNSMIGEYSLYSIRKNKKHITVLIDRDGKFIEIYGKNNKPENIDFLKPEVTINPKFVPLNKKFVKQKTIHLNKTFKTLIKLIRNRNHFLNFLTTLTKEKEFNPNILINTMKTEITKIKNIKYNESCYNYRYLFSQYFFDSWETDIFKIILKPKNSTYNFQFIKNILI